MLLSIIITLVILGVALYILQLIPMNATIKQIIIVLCILFAFLYVLEAFGVFHGPVVTPHPVYVTMAR